jgi:hypothetical protein
MSLAKRRAKNMPKPDTGAACKHRSASHVIAARHSRLLRPSSRPSMHWDFLTTLWPRSKSVCEVKKSSWAKSLA